MELHLLQFYVVRPQVTFGADSFPAENAGASLNDLLQCGHYDILRLAHMSFSGAECPIYQSR